jgi:transposase
MNNAKKYDNEFKKNAVRLVFSSAKSHCEIANDLGIGQSTLSKWVRNSRLGRGEHLSSNKALNTDEKALQSALKELAIVKEERDILKKALCIFSLPLKK